MPGRCDIEQGDTEGPGSYLTCDFDFIRAKTSLPIKFPCQTVKRLVISCTVMLNTETGWVSLKVPAVVVIVVMSCVSNRNSDLTFKIFTNLEGLVDCYAKQNLQAT